MPHKKLQHFIKWFDIFIRAKTKLQKKKGKIKQREKEKQAYLAIRPNSSPSRPSPPPTPVVFLKQGAAWRPCHGRRRAPGHLLLLPRHLFMPGDAQKPSRSIPPLQSKLLPLSRRNRRRPKLAPGRAAAPAWPLTPRSPTKMSKTHAVLVLVAVQK